MPFDFKPLPIHGAFLITPHIFIDNRGVYKKIFFSKDYDGRNIPTTFCETSDIVSNKGVIRGLHFQINKPQAKLIHVIKGKLYDVFLDLRKDSPTYLKHFEILLNDFDNLVLFVPAGCAHGFMSLEDDTIFSYQCSTEYDPASSFGIRWDDEELNINWPIKEGIVISSKDQELPTLKEYICGAKEK